MSLQTESIKLRILATRQLLADLECQLKQAEKNEEAKRLQAEYSEMQEAKQQERDELEYQIPTELRPVFPKYVMPQFKAYLIISLFYRRQKRFGKKTPSIHYKADV